MRFDDSLYYFHVPVNILDLNIDADMKLVYMVLCSFTNSRTNLCYPSIKTISKKAGLSVRQTMRAIKKLVSAGLIEIIEKGVGRGNKNVYKIIVSEENKNRNKDKEKDRSVLPIGLLSELNAFGLNEDDIKKIEDLYVQKGEEYIKSALEYTKKHAKTNKKAYLVQALERDWAKDERKNQEEQNKIEKAKEEYKKFIGLVFKYKDKTYRVEESSVYCYETDSAWALGDILKNWDTWQPFLKERAAEAAKDNSMQEKFIDKKSELQEVLGKLVLK